MKYIQNNLTAVAIVFGFALVALAIYTSEPLFVGATAGSDERTDTAEVSPTRSDTNWVYGDPDAEITIVEFSDLECPFCARLHPTLKQLVDESNGGINWEYRHFPLPNHRGAGPAALIAECVGRELGTEAFWSYVDSVFADIGAGVDAYEQIAIAEGIEPAVLEECVASEKVQSLVRSDLETGRALGGSGTPFSVIVFPDGSIRPITGALPISQWRQAVVQGQ